MPTIRSYRKQGDRADRPPKHHTITWSLPSAPQERKRETKTFHGSFTEAKAYAAKRQAEIDSQGLNYVTPSKKTLAEWLREWLDGKMAIKPTTRYSYRYQTAHHIVPHIGNIPLSDLTPETLQNWVADLGKKPSKRSGTLSPASVERATQVVVAALKDAVRLGKLPSNPMDRVKVPRAQSRPPEFYEIDELWKLDAAFQGHRLHALFSLSWQTSLRLGELLALRWSGVDFDANAIHVAEQLTVVEDEETGKQTLHFEDTKTVAGLRTIPLPPETMQILHQHRERQDAERANAEELHDHDLVFCAENGNPLWPRNVERLYYRMRGKAGVTNHRFHVTRHTGASLQLLAEVPIEVIAKNLGHTNPGFTAKQYAHVMAEAQQAGAKKFSALLSKIQPPKAAEKKAEE